MPQANKRKKQPPAQRKPHSSAGAKVDRATQFMWLSRVFGFICFVFVGTATVLALSLIHLTSEVEANAMLVSKPTYSENLAYFEPLHVDMPTMDILAEMFVRQYISARNTVWKNAREMNVMWGPGGVVAYMSSPDVYERFWTQEATRYFQGEEDKPPTVTVEPDIKRIIKEGWNSWQIFFDTRTMRSPIELPVIDHWIATIQFRYYPSSYLMAPRLKNPVGFTVTQYHRARQKR